MDIDLEVMSNDDYYGGGADYYATTPWINRQATMTEYGAAGVPNRYLTAAYQSDGIWNAAHYKNAAFDSAAKSFLAAPDLKGQRAAYQEAGGDPAAGYARDHGLLQHVRHGRLVQGQELPGREPLARAHRPHLPRLDT